MSEIKENQKLKRFGTFIKQKIDIDGIPLLKNEETKKFFNPVSFDEKNITYGLYEYSREFLTNYIDISDFPKKEIRAVVLPDYKQSKYVFNGWYNKSTNGGDYSLNEFLKKLFIMTAKDDNNVSNYNVGSKNGITYYMFSSYNNVIKIGLDLVKDRLMKTNNKILSTSFESFVDTIHEYKYSSYIDKLSTLLNFVDADYFRDIVESCSMLDSGIIFEKEFTNTFKKFIEQKEKHFFDIALEDNKVLVSLLMTAVYIIWLYIPKNQGGLPQDLADMMAKPGKGKSSGKATPGKGNGNPCESEECPSGTHSKNTADVRSRQEIIDDSIEFFRNKIHNDAVDSFSFEEYIKDNNKSFGNESGFDDHEMAGVDYKKFDKNDTLGKYANISTALKTKYQFNKKKIYKVYESKILPYGYKLKPKECALILLDVSGSCHHLIPKFLELVYSPKVISEIYYFDTRLLIPSVNNLIKTKEDLYKFVKEVPMGGGTDLNVPLQELKELYKKRFPKNIFIFTDGYMSPVSLKGISANIITYSIDDFMIFEDVKGCKFVNIKIKQSDIM